MDQIEQAPGTSPSKKYEITNQTLVTPSGITLYRIRATRDIPSFSIKKGNLGGFVESEENLSHDGNAWIFHKARVYGDAVVCGNARVLGSAEVFGGAVVGDDACIHNRAQVCGNAKVTGKAFIYGSAWVGDAVQVCNAEVFRKTKMREHPNMGRFSISS